MDVLLQEATLADADLIAQMTRQAWSGRVAPGSTGHLESAERAASDLQAGGGFILLIDETPAGSVRWLPADGESDVWEIVRMGILPAWRGRQLSEHLLEAVKTKNDTALEWQSANTATTGYIFAAMVFWVFCFGMSRYSMRLERKLDTGHKH